MKLDDLKNIGIPLGNIVEFCFPPHDEDQIKLGYYGTIVYNVRKGDEDLHTKTPYLEIYHNKEKHGIESMMKEYTIDDIKWIVDKSKSSVNDVHTFC